MLSYRSCPIVVSTLMFLSGCERETRPAMPVPESVVTPAVTNETVEPELPEAESDEATRLVVSPSIEAPQPSAGPAPEVPEVPQTTPEAKLEAIPSPKMEAKPEVKTAAEPQTEISFVSAEDQKAIEGFLTSVSEWVSEARNVDMDRRQLIAKSILFNPQDADQEVEVVRALKQALDLTTHIRKIQLMNLRQKEVLSSDVINRWALDASSCKAIVGTAFLRIETSRGSFRWGRFAMMPCQVSSEIQDREDPELW